MVLGAALISEIVIIAIASVYLFANSHDVSVAPVLPWNGLTEGVAPGIGVFFAFWSWVGFEAAPNYAEEAKDPVKVIPIALIFSCVAVGILYTIMSWALVSAYGTNINWANVGSAGNTAVINGKTVPADGTNFVLGPVSAAAGEFWRDALSWLIISGSLACAAALTNAGLRYMYAMGREGLLPRYLGKTHPVHKSPYTAVLTWGALAVVLFAIFRATSHTGLDAYYWLSPQGVIWIVLVQALTALSVFAYFRRDHPDEQSWKTTVCAWLGFGGQLFVLALFYHYETFVAAGSSVYVKELFTIGSGTWSVPVSWLGIIGVGVPVASLAYAYFLRAQNPQKYAVMGRFVNEAAFAKEPA
jgi:amino acid transporter